MAIFTGKSSGFRARMLLCAAFVSAFAASPAVRAAMAADDETHMEEPAAQPEEEPGGWMMNQPGEDEGTTMPQYELNPWEDDGKPLPEGEVYEQPEGYSDEQAYQQHGEQNEQIEQGEEREN